MEYFLVLVPHAVLRGIFEPPDGLAHRQLDKPVYRGAAFQRCPSFVVIIQYEGYAVEDKTLHLGKGKEDPDPLITWYPRESYFDNSYIVGRLGATRKEVYESLLDIIKPLGIRAFVETVEKVTED